MANIYTLPKIKIDSPIIIDLGCSIGYESLKLYKLYSPKLLISVDPFEYNTKKTQELIDYQKFNYSWITDCCAISNQNGQVEMSYSISPTTNHSPCGGIIVDGKKYEPTHETAIVKTKTLYEIHPEPDIVKVDIEGHEWYIWNQLLNTESIKIIFLELHGTHTITHKDMLEKIEQLKKVYDLRWFRYSQAQTMEMDNEEEGDEQVFTGLGCYCHVLCERK